MSRAIFIENVAKKGKLSKAEAKRTVDLVLGEIEAGLKKSKKAGRYTIGNFGTFSIVKRKGRKGRNPQTGRGDPHQGLQGPQIPPRRPTPQGCWGEVAPRAIDGALPKAAAALSVAGTAAVRPSTSSVVAPASRVPYALVARAKSRTLTKGFPVSAACRTFAASTIAKSSRPVRTSCKSRPSMQTTLLPASEGREPFTGESANADH